jgi:GABA(A) receptor-associated protein
MSLKKMYTPTSMDEERSQFFSEKTFEQRRADCEFVVTRYPGRVPVICEKKVGDSVQQLDKRKYLVPNDVTVSQFVYILRKRISLTPEKALFLFTNDNTLPSGSETIATVHKRRRAQDGFLYLTYAGENTFGGVHDTVHMH